MSLIKSAWLILLVDFSVGMRQLVKHILSSSAHRRA